MALEPTTTPNESAEDVFAVNKRVEMTQQKTWKFGQAAADKTLPTCTPVGFNETTEEAGEWVAPDPTILTVTLTGATAGNFTITVNGVTTGNIAYDAVASDVEAALLAIGIKANDVLTAAVHVVSFDADDQLASLPTVSGTVTGITGGSPTATPTAGTASLGLHKIKGIVWPEPVDVSDSGEKLGVVMVTGNVDYNELEAVVAAGDVTALKAACRETLLPRGLNVQNLSQVR